MYNTTRETLLDPARPDPFGLGQAGCRALAVAGPGCSWHRGWDPSQTWAHGLE